MAQRVVIPRMGQTMTEGLIAKWCKKDGEAVQPGDDIYELEYDKATSVVQARAGGIIKLLYEEGAVAPLGEAVAVILEGGEEFDPSMARGAYSVANAAQGGALEVDAPETGALEATPEAEAGAEIGAEAEAGAEIGAEADAGAEIGAEADADAGAEVNMGAEAEADSGAETGADAGTEVGTGAEVEAGAEAGGERPQVVATPFVRSLARQMGIDIRELARDGERVTKQDLEAYQAALTGKGDAGAAEDAGAAGAAVEAGDASAAGAAGGAGGASAAGAADGAGGAGAAGADGVAGAAGGAGDADDAGDEGIRISPYARKIAKEYGIDITAIVPKDGRRITKDDVLSYYVQQTPERGDVPSREGPPREDLAQKGPPRAKGGLPQEGRRAPMKGMRKAIADNMTKSYFTYPTVTLTTDADMGALLLMREQWNEEFASGGVKITVTDMLVKAVAKALLEHRVVNTSLDGDEIVYHDEVNINVAVALEEGLVVPVVRHADRLGLSGIAEETKRLVGLANSGRLGADDMSGGTFTITNLGTFGIDAFNPIINYPQSAILGVGRTVEKPAVEGGQIVIQKRAVLSFTHDHRVIDGAPGAYFLRSVVRFIEKPFLLLVD
ncbi:MAG: 2-oxo acid dehydrogenase subunit E2 [Clostridiales bacterium]|nr:2-oxo acid dehydrogenase subunit E2 [Clostridiales bacterium]